MAVADKMKSLFQETQEEQFHFDETITELEEDISNFINFTNLDDAATINEAAEQISERIKAALEQGKQYNLKE